MVVAVRHDVRQAWPRRPLHGKTAVNVSVRALTLSQIRTRYVERGRALPSELEAELRRDAWPGARAILEQIEKRRRGNRAEGQRLRWMLEFERALWGKKILLVAGIDEAGRGPLAGPVVAACVALDIERTPRKLKRALDDSKQLTREERETAFALLMEARVDGVATIGVGAASVGEIDRINILRASLLAMRRALDALGLLPDHALVDGTVRPDLPCSSTLIIEGDGKSFSVAAASIIAKVVRDRLMRSMAGYHPEYGWDHNAGYSTPEHLGALARFGPCLQHRRSFRSVREHLLVRA